MLKKIQAVSGLIFAVFVGLHLLNTWLAVLGPNVYNNMQAWLRTAYQLPLLEVLLLAALVVHIVVGVARIVVEPRRTLTPRARLHRYAGFFLLVFISGHILAVRGASWFYDVYPGFEGLAFSLAAIPGYFYPYYFLLALAGFYHALNGSSIAAHRLGLTVRVGEIGLRRLSYAAAGLTVTALFALGGVVFDFTDQLGDVYDSDFARLAMEITGVTFTP